jgi:hypothetical protein
MTEYFSHDYDARNDEKMMDLMAEHGWEGYGLFWGIIELLYQNDGIMQPHYKRIAFALHTNEELIKSIVENFKLFEYTENEFFSNSVLSRLKERDKKSESARKSANSRWKNANAKRAQSDGNAIKESKVKEIKESKVKESKEKKEVVFPFDSEQFKEYWLYWKEYKKKEHKFSYKSEISEQAALKKLSELAGGNHDTAIKIIVQSIENGWQGLFELKTSNKISTASIKDDLEYFSQRKKEGYYK